jgi:hypothetical protein
MYVLQIVLSFLITVNLYADDFSQYVQEHWSSAYNVEINPEIDTSKKIEKPKGVRLNVLEVYYYDSKFKVLKDCLVYKTPKEKELGRLFVVNIPYTSECKEHLFDLEKSKTNSIYNFGIALEGKRLKLLIDTKTLVVNLLNKSEKTQLELGSISHEGTGRLGVTISLSHGHSGTLLDEGSICYDVDDKCNVVINKNCYLCPNNFYSVKASNCPTDIRKRCGPSSCGGKGEPACLRGVAASKYKGNYCIPDSPIGLCNKGLRVSCANAELICI